MPFSERAVRWVRTTQTDLMSVLFGYPTYFLTLLTLLFLTSASPRCLAADCLGLFVLGFWRCLDFFSHLSSISGAGGTFRNAVSAQSYLTTSDDIGEQRGTRLPRSSTGSSAARSHQLTRSALLANHFCGAFLADVGSSRTSRNTAPLETITPTKPRTHTTAVLRCRPVAVVPLSKEFNTVSTVS